VTDVTNNAVYEYSSTGTFLGAFVSGTSTLSQPIGLDFGPDHNLYVADGQGRVASFDGTTGTPLADLVTYPSGGLINPQFLAFSTDISSTPEPSSLVLAVLGLVALAAVRRSRRA
jgi:MYXO-CTERM domain-containing protein